MILNRIYTTPEIFDVKFDLGINYIYGEKHEDGSVNGIGKSLFLDFIDFCLLSHYERSNSSRLKSAFDAGLLNNTSVTLDFTIDTNKGSITRSFNEPKTAVFTWLGNTNTFDINELRGILGEIIFATVSYKGVFQPEWYRRLISFYIKIQKLSDEKFSNPFRFLKDLKTQDVPVYLLYLLKINNELPFNFSKAILQRKSYDESIKTIKAFILKAYGVKDLGEVKSRVEKINIDIAEVEDNIKKLYLLRNYDKLEAEADSLTNDIKELYYHNSIDKKNIEDYNASLSTDARLSTTNVERLYNEISSDLGITIKKSLDEAKEFRRNLSESRKSFINTTIASLIKNISDREQQINEKEKRRQEILNSLYTQTAYSDLASAYQSLANYKSQRDELFSQTRTLNDLLEESRKLIIVQQDLFRKLDNYLIDIKSDLDIFNSVIDEVLPFIYPSVKHEEFTPIRGKSDNMLSFKFWESVKHSHGKNIGRTLIFDLSVLFNSLYRNQPSPKFLIHDGIFDSLDKTHLIKTYEFIQKKLKEGYEFQYITTINEGGFVGKNFGDSDVINPDTMKQKAKIILSPVHKLLKADFYSN